MKTRAKKSPKASAKELVITPCGYDDQTIHTLLNEGKALLISGLLALNEGSNVIKVVRVIKAQAMQDAGDPLTGIRGWIFISGDAAIDGIHYIESGQGAYVGNIFDIAMTSVPCFAAIVNDDIIEKGANWHKLREAIDFALGFIEKD